jgi:type I restriction enzyme S subunit
MKSFRIAHADECVTEAGVQNGTRLVPSGTLLFVVRGMSLAKEFRVGVTSRPVAFNQDLRALVPSADIDPIYLTHFLRGSQRAVLGMVDHASHGTTRLTSDRVEALPVPIPPLDEQRRIAEVLDRAEALRAKRRAALAQLDTLTQSIFLDLFGDPASNPKSWPVRKLEDLLTSVTYGTSQKSSTNGCFPVLRMNNISRTGAMDLTDLKYMDLESKDHDRYLVKKGDVLFNRTNSAELVGKTALFREDQPMAYAGYLIRLRTTRENDPEFVAAFLNTRYAKGMLRGMCKSIIGMANISATQNRAMAIFQPPLILQQDFAARVTAVGKLRRAYQASLAELDALFASLQHRAFRGEL